MRWRIIPLEMHDAFLNMALDESISENVATGGQPTIRFYKWFPSAVSIGYFQSLNDVVNVKKCVSIGVNIVRRRTGGGAVYHSNSGEITYSVIGPVNEFPKNIIESYKKICGWVIKGLEEMDIHAEFAPINDIVVGEKKISGNAQTRRNNVLLQHGTILYDVNVDKMFTVLRVPDEKMRGKIIKNVRERVTRILDFQKVSKQETYEALLKGFTYDKDFEIGEVSEQEMNRAKELVKTKYATDEWNYMR
ncbi:MAG: biotin/lipoate A/B protein ligase family protein [archaeon]